MWWPWRRREVNVFGDDGWGGWESSKGDQDLFLVWACKSIWIEMNGKD